MREQYHSTGFMVDRSGKYGEKSVGSRASRGGVRGGGDSSTSIPGSAAGSPGPSMPSTPQGGPLPQFSKAQLADYQDSRGHMGIDIGLGGVPPGSAATTAPAVGSAPGTASTTAPGTPGTAVGSSAPGTAELSPAGINSTLPVTKTPGFSDGSLEVLVRLASGARAQNCDPGVSAITGAPQQAIDFSQIAMPVHAIGLARSGLNSREQTLDKRVRKELIPVRKRKLPPGQTAASAPASPNGRAIGAPPGSPGGITTMGAEFGFLNSPGGGSFTTGSRGNSPDDRGAFKEMFKGDVRNALSS